MISRKVQSDPVWSPGLYDLSLGPSALSRLSKSQYSEKTHAGSLNGVSYKLTACKTTIEFQRLSSRQETKMLFLAIPHEELGRSCTKEEPTHPSAWCSAWVGSIFFIVGKFQTYAVRLSGRRCVRARGFFVRAAWAWGAGEFLRYRDNSEILLGGQWVFQAVAFSTGRTRLTAGLSFQLHSTLWNTLCIPQLYLFLEVPGRKEDCSALWLP